MKTIKGGFRPNATPAKYYTLSNRADDINDSGVFRKNLKDRRKLIGDLCDFCNKPIYIHRHNITLKLRGYKFTCYNCNKPEKGKKLVWEFKYKKYENQ